MVLNPLERRQRPANRAFRRSSSSLFWIRQARAGDNAVLLK
jgi:hypothetical protein